MKKDRWIVACSFVICLTVSMVFVFGMEQAKLREKQYRTKYVTSSQVSRLQYILDTLLLKTQTLEMLVVENGGAVSNFDLIAEKLYDNPAIRSLQLAPDGKVTDIYPLKGNENGFVDLFHDPNRATEALAARDSGELTLSGPFELYQGGFGIVGRRPVYLPDGRGGRTFWGFTIIVLDLPDAFDPARLDIFVKEGFEYKLYRIHPDTDQVQMIDESSEEALQQPVEISFEVPNGTWVFSVMPRGGWVSWREAAFEMGVAFLLTVLVTFLAAFIIKLRRQSERLYQACITDSLTGLYNYSRLMTVLEKNEKERRPCAVYYMDLDGFKKVNDTFGHEAGNLVLIESARRLADCFGDRDAVFRNGGDEFCAVEAGSLSVRQCEDRAREIIERMRAPFAIAGRDVYCGISIGYARYPEDCGNMELLIRQADDNMYRMKKTAQASAGVL